MADVSAATSHGKRQRHAGAALLLLFCAACGQQSPSAADAPVASASTQRIALDERGQRFEQTLPSPDTSQAGWAVAPQGKAIRFGNPGAKPWISLDCRLSDEAPPVLVVIRHASGFPGQTALFAVMGNGLVSRLPAAAILGQSETGGEWRWEASLPAADPQWDLFIGTGDMRATLPGKGAIEIPPNPIPGEFVSWCRAGGRPVPAPVPEPASAPSETPEAG